MKITFEIQKLFADYSKLTQVEFWGWIENNNEGLIVLGMGYSTWIAAGRPVTFEMEVPLDPETPIEVDREME